MPPKRKYSKVYGKQKQKPTTESAVTICDACCMPHIKDGQCPTQQSSQDEPLCPSDGASSTTGVASESQAQVSRVKSKASASKDAPLSHSRSTEASLPGSSTSRNTQPARAKDGLGGTQASTSSDDMRLV